MKTSSYTHAHMCLRLAKISPVVLTVIFFSMHFSIFCVLCNEMFL